MTGELTVRLSVVEGADHSLYREFIEAPPPGVRYITDAPKRTGDTPEKIRQKTLVQRLRANSYVRSLTDPVFVRSLPEGDAPPGGFAFKTGRAITRLAGGSAGKTKEQAPFDVFHSAGSAAIENIPWFVEKDVRWIVDFEFAAAMFGYYGNWRKRIYSPSAQKRLVKVLSSRYCREAIPWTEAARKTIEHLVPSKEVEKKTEVVRLAVRPAPPKPNDIEKHDRVRILFMGSSNYRGEFYSKGGLEVLEIYRRLRDRMGDSVELTFRCWMPDELRGKYASTPGLHVLSDMLPRDMLDRLFWDSDIFLFPSHHTPGMAFLEAMRFGLPIVTRDLWANSELVKNGVHGYLVKPSEKIPYYLPGNVPNWSMDDGPFLPYMKMIDDRVVVDFVEKLSSLASSESTRKGMGAAGRREVEEGDASLSRRNAAYRRIYEEAARR